MNLEEFNEWIETYKYDDDGKFTIYVSTMDLHKLCEDYHKEQLALYNVSQQSELFIADFIEKYNEGLVGNERIHEDCLEDYLQGNL